MDKKAFKLRMQALKSYREQNPGKGYLDFKAYADGGETGYELPEVVVTGRKLDKLKPYGNITDMVTLQPSTSRLATSATPVGQSEDVVITAKRVNKPIPFGNFSSMVLKPELPNRLNMMPTQQAELPYTPEPTELMEDEALPSNPQLRALSGYTSDMPLLSMPSMPGTSSIIEPDRQPLEELPLPLPPLATSELGQYDQELSKKRVPNRYNTNFAKEREWLIDFAKERAKLPLFKDQLDNDELTKYIFRVNNTPIISLDPEMYRGPRNSAGVTKYDVDLYVNYDSPEFYNTGANILLSNDPTYGGNTTPFSTDLDSNALHELDHATLVSTSKATGSKKGFSKRILKTADVIGYDLNNAKNSSSNYGNTPWEVLSRRQQLLYDLKSDPTKVYNKKDLKNMRSLLKKYDLNYLGDDKILQLLNDVAANQQLPSGTPDNSILENRVFHAAKGGEVPPNKPVIPADPQPYKGKLVKDRYGKKYTELLVAEYYDNTTDEIDRFTGGPLVRGMKGAIDLEDAANVTPVGDAISVYDTYNAAKQGNWTGAGLAALTLLPFVPRAGNKLSKPITVKEFRKKYKGTTPKPKTKSYDFNTAVNKNYAQDRMNEYARLDKLNLAKRTKAVNQSYNIAERLMDDPDYMTRALEVKKLFGDDYIRPYSDIILYYNTDPSKLPNVSLDNLGGSRGRMTNALGKYSYKLDPLMTDLDEFLTEHEYGHYVDLKRNRDRLDAEGDSNMFYQMSKDFSSKPIDSKGYYMKPTELKSHMNLLREYMFLNGLINRRGQKVSEKMLEKALKLASEIPSLKGVAKASLLFKNMGKYTKWFNAIPLLGIGATAVYNTKEE